MKLDYKYNQTINTLNYNFNQNNLNLKLLS